MYQLPNFDTPITPDSIEIKALRINFITNLLQIEVAFVTNEKTYIHTSELTPFAGRWQHLDLQALLNAEICKFVEN